MEVSLLAARRIGGLVPAEKAEKAGAKGGRGKKGAEVRRAFPEHQRLSEFRKLAEIPEHKFRERIAKLKAREEKITYPKLLSDAHVSHAAGELDKTAQGEAPS